MLQETVARDPIDSGGWAAYSLGCRMQAAAGGDVGSSDDSEQESVPSGDGREPEGFWDAFAPGARRIVTHARWLAGAFLGSWLAAVGGARLDVDPLYYAGLGGVGLTMVLVLIWLSP